MIDDYKYMYLYTPYIWMYILRIVLIFRIFSLFGGLGLGIRILALG